MRSHKFNDKFGRVRPVCKFFIGFMRSHKLNDKFGRAGPVITNGKEKNNLSLL
jgi:hypothetical protein